MTADVDERLDTVRWWMFRTRLTHWYLRRIGEMLERIEWRGAHSRSPGGQMSVAVFRDAQIRKLAAQCRNLVNLPLRPETQERLVTAVVNPSPESWQAAKAVMVQPGVTAAAAVQQYSGDSIPDPDTICFALAQALATREVA